MPNPTLAVTPLGALTEELKRIRDSFVDEDEEVEVEKERRRPENCCDARDVADIIADIPQLSLCFSLLETVEDEFERRFRVTK